MDTIVVNPQLIGDWRNALAKDASVAAEVQNSGGSGVWNQATLNAFAASPATGCASILEIARVKSGYNPLDPAQTANQGALLNWISEVKTCISNTLFSQEYGDNVTIGGASDWPTYVQQAINTYVGITDADKSRLQMSVQNLVQAAYSAPNQPEVVIMVQHAIQANTDGSVSIYFYFTSAVIKYSVGSGKHATSSLGSIFNIYRAKLNLNMTEYQSISNQVANTRIELVKNWLNNMSGSSAYVQGLNQLSVLHSMSCFQPVPSLENAQAMGNGDDYWRSFSWEQLPLNAQELWGDFGWNNKNWDGIPSGFPSAFYLPWNQLLPGQVNTAKLLGYDELLWNGPSVSEATLQANMMAYWRKFEWLSIPVRLQNLWVQLGWSSASWSGTAPEPLSVTTNWNNLTLEQQRTASLLGFASGNWSGG
ncbi:hypothetical protein [Lacihabitans soyangensis]|uniref:Uncharacterized protein n=1 Tax=Lacihabitans soyangensis TaxID=869394 RepID=A0AAE3H6X4_9BACT|nr:hypothetical protein [Lacihabitans soyangensis]MCP9765179.1 hypothetical protein [Lacihabitans soyangensis]